MHALVLNGREMFGGLPDGRARLGGGVERNAGIDFIPQGRHTLALTDGFLKMRCGGLAMGVRRR